MTNFERLSAEPLTEKIARALLGKILSGELRPGEWLPAERDMAEQLGVSRSSLHHAVLQLESQGFLKVEPRRGTVVADYGSIEIDEPLFHDMMDARIWLETGCARRACRNIYDSTLEEMQAIADRMEDERDDLPGIVYRYHYMLTQASGNSIFSIMFRAFEPVITTLITRYYTMRNADIAAEAAMHKELLDHIRAKDEDAAAECVERMLRLGMSELGRKYEK